MLLLLGAISAVAYCLVFTVTFPLTHYHGELPTQIPEIGSSVSHAFLFAAGWLILFAAYYAAYRLCPEQHGRRQIAVVVGGSLLFGVLMLLTYPFSSTDVFDYIGRAHFITDRGGNPMVVSPEMVPKEYPLIHYITSYRAPSPYGPLWHNAAAQVVRVTGGNVAANLVGMKLFTLSCFWAGMPFVYRALQRFNPRHALRGLLLYAWCPAALFELGTNGHNDALLLLCLVIAAYLLIVRRPGLAIVAVVAASMVKLPALVLLPIFLVAAVRMPETTAGKVRALAGGCAGAVALPVLLYAPFGLSTARTSVETLLQRGDLRANSLSWLLSGMARDWLHLPEARIAHWITRLGVAATAAVLGVCLLRLARARIVLRAEVPREAVFSSFLVLLVFLGLAVAFFWPWYVLWLLAFAPLLSRRGVAALTTAFTCGAFGEPLTTAYWSQISASGFLPAMALLVFGPVAVTAAWLGLPVVLRRNPGARLPTHVSLPQR
jgi:hypothetical protein